MEFSFQMVETDPHQPTAVETMDEMEFGNYINRRQAAVGMLSQTSESYPAKKLLLEQAVKMERDATEVLRSIHVITVTPQAAGQDLTAARKTAMLVRQRQALFAARQNFIFIKSKLS